MNIIFILCTISLIPIIASQAIQENIILNVNEYFTLKSENFPEPYPEGTWEWLIESGDGFGVEIIMKSLDLNSEVGDYILFQPGGKGNIQEPSKIFTWNIKEEKKFRLHHLDILYIEFKSKKSGHKNKGFEMDLKAIGEIITTTEPPTTEDPSLIMTPLQTSYIYLSGTNVTEFRYKYQETFREELASLAEKYCMDKNITIETNISITRNVNFHIITTCPLDWVDYENCVAIRYSIPVNSLNLTDGYELTNKSLDDMWYSNNKNMNWTDLGLINIFYPPDTHSMMMGWVWVSIGVLILFLIFLYLLQRYNCFDDIINTLLIPEDVERRKSDASFFPTPHQDLPPLFLSDSFPDEKNWISDIPPEYSEKPHDGEINLGFEKDNIIFDDDIIMTLEDTMDQKSQLTRRSVDTVDKFESNL